MQRFAYGIVLLCALTGSAAATSILTDVYHIGNSLTFDMVHRDKMNDLAAGAGFADIQTGYHVRCSKGPVYIYQNPGETLVSTPQHTPALTDVDQASTCCCVSCV